MLTEPHAGNRGLDGLKRSANFFRRLRLGIERIELAWRAIEEEDDAMFGAAKGRGLLVLRGRGPRSVQVRQREAQQAGRPGLEHIAPRNAIAQALM